MMNRRDFLKTTALTGVAIAIAGKVSAVEKAVSAAGVPDLVAVSGGEPEQLFEAAIEAVGGMKAFVKPGQTVVIKPNIGWHRKPEEAANTNPDLIRAIVKSCFAAGAKSVTVFDHTCDKDWQGCYDASGMTAAVAGTGAKLVCGNLKSEYRTVKVDQGRALKTGLMNHLILDSDVFINVPVLKNHGGAKLTCAMKNLMGIVFDRREFHQKDLQQCIADWVTVRKPDLNIVDAYRAMQTGGPRGNAGSKILPLKSLLLSRDIVAVDVAGAKMLNIKPETVGHLALGAELGLGTTDLDKLNIKRIKLG